MAHILEDILHQVATAKRVFNNQECGHCHSDNINREFLAITPQPPAVFPVPTCNPATPTYHYACRTCGHEWYS